MRAAGSPFQAKSSQEQKEQWIWWQCQRDTVPPEEEAPPVNVLPERDAPPYRCSRRAISSTTPSCSA